MMDGNVLGQRIQDEIDSLPDQSKANREEIFKAIGRAVVKYLQEEAIVLPGIQVKVDTNSGVGNTIGQGKIS
jgi:hypothetical protein